MAATNYWSSTSNAGNPNNAWNVNFNNGRNTSGSGTLQGHTSGSFIITSHARDDAVKGAGSRDYDKERPNNFFVTHNFFRKGKYGKTSGKAGNASGLIRQVG